MAKISFEDKKAEAVARMKMLGIFPETIRQFDKDGLVSISEPPLGAFFWTAGEDLEHIRSFEERYNVLVYLVVRSYTEFGRMDSCLYVSDHPDEWGMDREDIRQGQAYAYVYNHDDPECSEIGSIGIMKTPAAGLRRIW